MYFGMGMLFSLAYTYTNRITIPIGIHMLQNGTVVIMQVFGGDALKKYKNKPTLSSILYLIKYKLIEPVTHNQSDWLILIY